LPDGELLAKLRAFGIELDRSSLARRCEQALSAEEIATALLAQPAAQPHRDDLQSDWIWIAIATLWQRWFPEIPSFERLDDQMQAGYDLLAAGNAPAACRVWLEAWHDVLRLLDKAGLRSIADFDARFRGTQALFNWIQDLETELWNAGLRERQFLTARIAVCEEGLRRFPADEALLTENRRRALAESYAEVGEAEKADLLYREWLIADPRWGWGWIGWADIYRFTHTERRDVLRAEQILRDGLAVAEVQGRADLLDRLADLCHEQGRRDEADALWRQAKHAAAATERKPTVRSDGPALRRSPSAPPTVGKHKVGRNDPCPCGSGKKFKRCCGAGL
jgi:tetratricopeptide (TPR) repeat protein